MRELQHKQRIRQTLYSIPSILLILIITFVMAKGAWSVLKVEGESRARVGNLKEKIAALALREKELQEGIARLGTEEGVKEEIKQKFNVTEAGEYVAIVVDPRLSKPATTTPPLVWYKRMWGAIIGR